MVPLQRFLWFQLGFWKTTSNHLPERKSSVFAKSWSWVAKTWRTLGVAWEEVFLLFTGPRCWTLLCFLPLWCGSPVSHFTVLRTPSRSVPRVFGVSIAIRGGCSGGWDFSFYHILIKPVKPALAWAGDFSYWKLLKMASFSEDFGDSHSSSMNFIEFPFQSSSLLVTWYLKIPRIRNIVSLDVLRPTNQTPLSQLSQDTTYYAEVMSLPENFKRPRPRRFFFCFGKGERRKRREEGEDEMRGKSLVFFFFFLMELGNSFWPLCLLVFLGVLLFWIFFSKNLAVPRGLAKTGLLKGPNLNGVWESHELGGFTRKTTRVGKGCRCLTRSLDMFLEKSDYSRMILSMASCKPSTLEPTCIPQLPVVAGCFW